MLLTSIRTFHWSVFGCVTGVIFADWLFFNQPAGLNVFVFHIFLLGFLLLQIPLKNMKRHAWLILCLLAGLLFSLMTDPGPLRFWLTWLGLITFVFTARQSWSSNTIEWLARWFHFAFALLTRIPLDLVLISRWFMTGHGSNPFEAIARNIIKWLLPVAGACLFILLFTMANPVLSYWFQELERSITNFLDALSVTLPRFIQWAFVATAFWTFVRIRYKRRHFPAIGAGHSLPDSLLHRCLVLFNLIFAIQTILDFIYLWGGAALPAEMSYAEYAHRGAYPLIGTALLAGGFVLATFRAGAPPAGHVRKLVYVWLAQNILLIINSLWRLHLYVEVYSLTTLRLAAAIWMLLVSAGIALVMWRIYAGKSNAWLLNANFLTLVSVLYVCCFLNFDRTISWYNVQNCKEISGKSVVLDIHYLERLGIESIPALIWFHHNTKGAPKATEAHLAANRLMHNLNQDSKNWKAWTLRRHILRKELAAGKRKKI